MKKGIFIAWLLLGLCSGAHCYEFVSDVPYFRATIPDNWQMPSTQQIQSEIASVEVSDQEFHQKKISQAGEYLIVASASGRVFSAKAIPNDALDSMSDVAVVSSVLKRALNVFGNGSIVIPPRNDELGGRPGAYGVVDYEAKVVDGRANMYRHACWVGRVDDLIFVVNFKYRPDSSEEIIAEMDSIIESIRFTPASSVEIAGQL